ncbi:amidohydrolase family protein [Formosa sp. L2A11]|uniref:amidohydrolase family protein n=1 Tax=Formosa sp. L2A11 TaxID=2686363 RepID=UPI00131E0547|nr:amidohydrolase family protein [Formosa sp. L2A11]
MNNKKVYRFLMLFSIFMFVKQGYSQETFPKNDVTDTRPQTVAFTNATIIVNPTTTIENGTLLIKDGAIVSVSNTTEIPKGYTQIDLIGKYIYPSFIDMFSTYGQPEVKLPKRENPFIKREQIQSSTKGPYNANEAIKSNYNGTAYFRVNEKRALKLRAQGFGAVASMRPDGIARGTATFVALGNENENSMVLKNKVASHYSFDKGTSTQDYPISPMGSIALLRQTFYDAKWYVSNSSRTFSDLTLEAIENNKDLPQIFEAKDWLTDIQVHKIGQEFNMNFIIKGGGNEYQRLEEIKQLNSSLIIPINFPSDYNVTDPVITDKITLADLKHWELAPSNPSHLEQEGISFALTTYPQENPSHFLENLRKAVAFGLTKKQALSSLTTTPAKLLKVDDLVGTLSKGKLANFIIADGDILENQTLLLENWVKGKPYIIQETINKNFVGAYILNVGSIKTELKIGINKGKYIATISSTDGSEDKADFRMDGDLPILQFVTNNSQYNLKGWQVSEPNKIVFKGTGTLNFKDEIVWSAEKTANDKLKDKKESSSDFDNLGAVFYPFLAFGNTSKITSENILITNVTIWTNEESGILEGTDILLEGGKISKIGKNLSAEGSQIIDGTGKHLTPGIIDEHSHIALNGINEIAPNSSMVRMDDVVDSEDPGIYRALAGGVVAAQLLHGSSDPIGGQSALIKLKWGESPEGLIIKDADPFIKFALGENPKRSKSGPSIRFPRSLMGMEQFYTDAFTEALAYQKKRDTYNQLSKKQKAKAVMPRKNLVHEAMLEVIEEKRFISSHSYQQKEMLMLMDVADRFGFTINTFTHALEGYRIADKMLEHGVGGSTFSDRWNFKWETRNAIPYNATIMNTVGVTTAINSDSGETIRHLNHEASKAIKYGNTSQEDALKMITLNPAKLLHLDDTMGSIKVGKSADVVLWSGPPLSVYSKVEKTIIEGAIYFDIEKDKTLRTTMQNERARILSKMDGLENGANPTKISKEKPEFDCEYIQMGN